MKLVSKTLIFWVFVSLMFIHLIAVYFSIYWTEPRFDIFMHVLGGLSVALFVLALLEEIYDGMTPRLKALVCMIFGALIIGVLWEVYEYFVGATFVTARNFKLDTTTDIIMDIIGGFLAFVVALRFGKREEPIING